MSHAEMTLALGASITANLARFGTPNWNTSTASQGFITYDTPGGTGEIRFDEDGHYYLCTAKGTGKRTVKKEYRSAHAAVNYVMGRCSNV